MPTSRFAISQITTRPWTLQQDLSTFARMRVGIELHEAKFSQDPARFEDEIARVSKSGLRVTSIQPATLSPFPSASAPEPASPDERCARLRHTLERFGPHFPGLPVVTNTGALADSGNEAAVWDGCVHHYRSLAESAANHGLTLAVEALGPSLMNRNSVLHRFDEACALVEAIDRPNVKVCLDLYNSAQDRTLTESIHRHVGHIGLVQLADWRRPRSYHDRLALGMGESPLPEWLKALAEAGYAGDYVLEIFSEDVEDSLWRSTAVLEQALIHSRDAFEQWCIARNA